MPKPKKPLPKLVFQPPLTGGAKSLSAHLADLNGQRGIGWALRTRLYRTYGSLAVLLDKLNYGLGGPHGPPRPRSQGVNSDDGITAEAYDVSRKLDAEAGGNHPGWIPGGQPRTLATGLRDKVKVALNY